MAQLRPLFKVQQLDLQIRDLRRQRAALEQPSPLVPQVQALEEDLHEAGEAVRKNQKSQKNLEHELAAVASQRKGYEDKLYGGMSGNMKELAGWQKEIDQLTVRQEKLEEQLLEFMERAETLELKVKDSTRRLDEKQKQLADSQVEATRTIAGIDVELEALLSRRAQVSETIDAALMKRYEALRKQKAGVAIVKVLKDACGGCYMNLSAQALERVAARDLVVCGHCGRILLAEGSA